MEIGSEIDVGKEKISGLIDTPFCIDFSKLKAWKDIEARHHYQICPDLWEIADGSCGYYPPTNFKNARWFSSSTLKDSI